MFGSRINMPRIKSLIIIIMGLWTFTMSGWASAVDFNLFGKSKSVTPKIIAIGDIHGDYEAYSTILQMAGLIDAEGEWIGGDAILVQTGDIPDRGPDTSLIFEHIRKLQKQAPEKGGKVVALIGNHEVMNVTGDLRYVHAGEYAAFVTKGSEKSRKRMYKDDRDQIRAYYKSINPKLTYAEIKDKWEKDSPLGMPELKRAWAPKGQVGEWVIQNDTVCLIEGNLFTHGGFSQKYTKYSLNKINKTVRRELKRQDTSKNAFINDPLGPVWYRGNVMQPDKVLRGQTKLTPEEEIDLVLETYGAKRLIVGHTPVKSGIEAKYGGKLIQIDTGASAFYGGTRSFLRIENGHVYAHDNGIIRQLE